MLQHDTTSFVYHSHQEGKSNKSNDDISTKDMQKILQVLAKQVLKDRTTSMQELERMLQGNMQRSDEQDTRQSQQEEAQLKIENGDQPMTKYLQKMGYLKDEKKWLSNKGFFEIGLKILHDVMKAINDGGSGFHPASEAEGALGVDPGPPPHLRPPLPGPSTDGLGPDGRT